MVHTLKKQQWFHPDGFPVAVERRDPQQPFGLHAHDFAELVIITGGHGLHVTGQQSWPLAPGDVFVIGQRRPHDYQNMDNLRLINILYDPANIPFELLDLPSLPGYHAMFKLEPAWRHRHRFNSRLRLPPRDLATLVGHVDQLDHELRVRSPGFRFVAIALFMQVIGYLARHYSQSRNPDSRALLQIAGAISHLEAHFAQPANLDDLAAMARMSKRSFLRAFQAAVGKSPIAYLIQLRINRAAILLRTSRQSVTEIAYDVGFSDSNYFTRQFRQLVGISPRSYRQQHAQAS